MPDLNPVNRLHAFLAAIAGDESAPELTPRDQLEYYLAKMAERVDNIQPGAGWHDGVPYAGDSYLPLYEDHYISLGGQIVAYNGWDITEHMPCEGAAKITFSGTSRPDYKYCAFYSASGRWMSNMETNKIDSNNIQVPAGAATFRVSSTSATVNNLLTGSLIITPYAEV